MMPTCHNIQGEVWQVEGTSLCSRGQQAVLSLQLLSGDHRLCVLRRVAGGPVASNDLWDQAGEGRHHDPQASSGPA